jgi:hypothetical protein
MKNLTNFLAIILVFSLFGCQKDPQPDYESLVKSTVEKSLQPQIDAIVEKLDVVLQGSRDGSFEPVFFPESFTSSNFRFTNNRLEQELYNKSAIQKITATRDYSKQFVHIGLLGERVAPYYFYDATILLKNGSSISKRFLIKNGLESIEFVPNGVNTDPQNKIAVTRLVTDYSKAESYFDIQCGFVKKRYLYQISADGVTHSDQYITSITRNSGVFQFAHK